MLLAAPTLLSSSDSVLSPSEQNLLRIGLTDDRIENVRVEMFDVASHLRVYDSGIRSGRRVEIELPAELTSSDAVALTVELRAWDVEGNLVLSQISSFQPSEGPLISSIGFEIIPAGFGILATPITLESDVDVTGGLDVAGALSASEIRASGGGPFFAVCPPNSSIRSINPDGTVACEMDDGGDNLGNHTADFDLQMGSHSLLFDKGIGLRAAGGGQFKTGPMGMTFMFFAGGPTGDIAQFRDDGSVLKLAINNEGMANFANGLGLSADGGARLLTGPGGQTFQFYAGGPAGNIANFKDVSGVLKLAVKPNGNLGFNGGQKVCSVFDGFGRSSIIASAGWTAGTCSSYRAAVLPGGGNYQLACVFDTSFSFGPANGGAPTPNCGW